jgi:hypothetical protein
MHFTAFFRFAGRDWHSRHFLRPDFKFTDACHKISRWGSQILFISEVGIGYGSDCEQLVEGLLGVARDARAIPESNM